MKLSPEKHSHSGWAFRQLTLRDWTWEDFERADADKNWPASER
jgi:hypothetical protein